MLADAVAALFERPDLTRLLAALHDPVEETRIVGGALRNTLLGRPVRDIDLATTALPEATMRRARKAGLKAVPTGIEHGTVTIVVEGRPFEVTTLREDIETDGRHAVVRFGRDFEADARRRDFTINALSAGADGRLHDTCGGLADLDARRVRFIGDAEARIREDYLRILRFFRFSAEYGEGPLDAAGLAATIRERAGLDGLSRERVREEMVKLFAAPRAVEIVGALAESGLAIRLLGAVIERGRLLRATHASEEALPRLAAASVLVREDAARLQTWLRLSNADAKRLTDYAVLLEALKSRPLPIDEPALRRLVVEHGAASLREALTILNEEPRPILRNDASAALARFLSGEDAIPVFPLRAADLFARGVAPGPEIGTLLGQARERWLAEGCPAEATPASLLAGAPVAGSSDQMEPSSSS